MKRWKSQIRLRHLCAFLFGVLISYAYIEWGTWGRVPMRNMSQPAERWAQILYWPGLEAGNWAYGHFSTMFRLRVAVDLAGVVGMLVMGLCCVVALEGGLAIRRLVKRS